MVELTENSLHVLKERYLRKDKDGNVIETPEQLFYRVSHSICGDYPDLEKRMMNRMMSCDFYPNSPTLMNAGTDMSQLSACFTIEILDDLVSIFNGVKHTALIFQTGGGVGATFEHIRPKGDRVKSTQGVASGPISFMSNYNIATEVIKQGGKRRGAFMALMSISHPDILNFICCKDRGDTLSNMNISVTVTDDFMNSVIENKDWNLEFKGKVYKTIKSRELFNEIVKHAHYCGDPGIIFIDAINRNNKGKWIRQVNPCSEQPLLPYESCNLGSVKICNFVKNGDIDWKELKECVYDSIEFLDLVIDKNSYSETIMKEIPMIKDRTLETRKIGLGLMGWADALILLGIPYNDERAFNLAERLMKFIHESSLEKSRELALLKGEFPKFKEYYGDSEEPLRNANLTTIAPTGTISVIANCSSGIEPLYSIVYKRNLKDTIGKDLYEINSLFLEIAKKRGFYSPDLIEKISNNSGSIRGISEVPEDVRKLFLVAHDISYEDHIKMQSSFQKYTQSGISKTINFPSSATIKDVYNSYILAWKLGCKGIAIYRDGSKENQVFTIEKRSDVNKINDNERKDKKYEITRRPKILPALSFRKITACSTLYYNLTKSWDKNGVFDEFNNKADDRGGCQGLQDALTTVISVYNRYIEGLKNECSACGSVNDGFGHYHSLNSMNIISSKLLLKRCGKCEKVIENQKDKDIEDPVDSLSCANALGQCLKYMLDHKVDVLIDGNIIKEVKIEKELIKDDGLRKCPECGNKTMRSEGCMNDTCIICGWGGCI